MPRTFTQTSFRHREISGQFRLRGPGTGGKGARGCVAWLIDSTRKALRVSALASNRKRARKS
jgi:hypothetical protein